MEAEERDELRFALIANMGHAMTSDGIEWLVRLEERVRDLEAARGEGEE